MARPRKPTKVKELQGTLQPCRTNLNEPKIESTIKSMTPPEYLSDRAKQLWTDAIEYCPDDMITNADVSIFEQWCVTYDQLASIQEELKKSGITVYDEDGVPRPNPLINAQIKLQQTLRLTCTELGFTPASRSKVSVSQKAEQPDNPFLQLVG